MSPTISRRRVKATRREWFCEACQKHRPAGTPCVALFGSAERGDAPYQIRLCDPPCEEQARSDDA